MKTKHPLGRTIAIMCAMFIAVLVAVLSGVSYVLYTRSMYRMYQDQMTGIVNYLESTIDHDDMAECARTWTESERYKESRELFDNFIDTYTNIHYLYIVKPLEAGDPVKVRSILSANSTYEKQYEPENVLYIGDGEEAWYDEETAQTLREIIVGNKDVFFLDRTEWGTDYTLARPLINSAGEHYGLLCVDIDIDDIQKMINKNININIMFVVGLGALFIFGFLVWVQRKVTIPLRELEYSVVSFANSSHGKRDPEELVYTPPDIHTGNEVESLSKAVVKLNEDMRDYVNAIVSAEDVAKALQSRVTKMNVIAYQDALTGVKNKAAYDKKLEALNWDILNYSAAFALVMVDLNYLKIINDRYGHDKGNEYIKGSCLIMCSVFHHSPVYRIGGDEFVAVLEGEDYHNRDELFAQIQEEFRKSASQSDLSPWQRYSAAAGMAAYRQDHDMDAEAVFERADGEMYVAKVRMKNEGAPK